MSIKLHQRNVASNNNKNLCMTPKLALQGHNIFLPALSPSLTYHIQNVSYFLNTLKPLPNTQQRNIQFKQMGPVQVRGKSKKVQTRQATTGIPRNRRFHQQIHSQMINQQCSPDIVSPYRYLSEGKGQDTLQKIEGLYYFYIGIGNNCALVEKVVRRRRNWEQTKNTLFDFRWQQTRIRYQKMNNKKIAYNHLPNHEAVSDKGSLLKNLKVFCERIKQPIFNIVPACFQLNFGEIQVCEEQLKRFIRFYWQNRQNNKKSTVIKNQSQKEKSPKKDLNKYVETNQRINETKQSLKSSNIFRTSKKQISIVHSKQSDKKRQQIKEFHRTIATKLKKFCSFQDLSIIKPQSNALTPSVLEVYGDTNLWLLKPTDLNRGRGIKLFRTVQELSNILSHELTKNPNGKFILQKYIEKPLLICNRKFDIRVWAMVSQNRDIFYFKEGYLRTSCQQYSVDSDDQFTHLTNNAVQKHSKKYGKFQDGNQISLQFLYQLLNKQLFLSQMKNYIKICFSSVINHMFDESLNHSQNKSKYFEIFGYDFMVDVNQHLWLIEVNTNPCLEQSSSLLSNLIPRMLDDAFSLTIDKIFPKSKLKPQQKPFPVQGYLDHQNMWQPIELIQITKNSLQLITN